MRSPAAGLTTRGRCALAAGAACAVCAVVLDERDLLRVGALLLALPVLSLLVCRVQFLRMHVTRAVRPLPLAVGDAAEVELTLQARSRSPMGGMVLRDAVPDSCGPATRYTLGRLKSGAVASVHYPIAPRLRGVHRLGPLQVSLGDVLGLAELTRTVGDPSEVLVRPQTVDLRGRPEVVAAGAERGTPVRTLAPTVRDAQLRTYIPGDDTRSIHWPSTARRDELTVRTAEHGQDTGIVVLLDTRRCAHDEPGEQSSIERAISLAASIAVHLREIDTPVRVLTTDGVQLGSTGVGLDQLARVSPSERHDLGGVLRLIGRDGFIGVFGRLDVPAATGLLGGIGRARSACAFHLLASPGAPVLASAGWRVVGDDHPTPLAPLWTALGRTTVGAR